MDPFRILSLACFSLKTFLTSFGLFKSGDLVNLDLITSCWSLLDLRDEFKVGPVVLRPSLVRYPGLGDSFLEIRSNGLAEDFLEVDEANGGELYLEVHGFG